VRHTTVGLRLPIVFHHRPVFDAAAGGSPNVRRSERQHRRKRSDTLPFGLPRQAISFQLIPSEHAILKPDSADRKVWIVRCNLHSDGSLWWHCHRLLNWLHDPHLRREVGNHLDAVPNLLSEDLVGAR